MKKQFVIVIPSFVFILFFACVSMEDNIADTLYQKRDYLLREFENKTIIKSRGGNVIQFSFYNNQKINKFFFEKIGKTISLISDSIQFPINELTLFARQENVSSKVALENEAKRLLNVMDSLSIKDVSAEFSTHGIKMKIYFGENSCLLYVPDTQLVVNSEWKKYLSSSKRMDEYWFYLKNDY